MNLTFCYCSSECNWWVNIDDFFATYICCISKNISFAHMHNCFNSHVPSEPGLAGFLLDSYSLLVLLMSIHLSQTETLHKPLDNLTKTFLGILLSGSTICFHHRTLFDPVSIIFICTTRPNHCSLLLVITSNSLFEFFFKHTSVWPYSVHFCLTLLHALVSLAKSHYHKSSNLLHNLYWYCPIPSMFLVIVCTFWL